MDQRRPAAPASAIRFKNPPSAPGPIQRGGDTHPQTVSPPCLRRSPMRVAISSGHALHVQGAVGILNELTENRRVTPIIANHLRAAGVNVVTFDDNTSRTVAQNLDTINGWHNRQTRDLDVQVHFNAFAPTQAARGTEVCHRDQAALATRVSAAM